MKRFTADDARRTVLAKVAKAGAKGATSLYAPKTAEPKRGLLEEAAAALEREQLLFVDRRKAKPRFFAQEHRPALPTAECVAVRLEEIAAADFPALATRARWKTALKGCREEALLLESALEHLLSTGRLLRLLYRKASAAEEVFVPVSALPAAGSPKALAFSPEPVRQAYASLASRTGFPAVDISQLSAESGTDLEALKNWLTEEYRAGRAILSRGDWSLAGEDKRLAAVEWQGQAYLLVRLLP